jgi:hypothetical protein
MADDIFTLAQNDTLPILADTLLDVNGAAVDLTGASVELRMQSDSDPSVTFSAAATITNAPAGRVSYAWQPGDTAVVGDYEAVWRVTFSDLTVLTFPNDRPFRVRITSNLFTGADWPLDGDALLSYVTGMGLLEDPPTAAELALDYDGAVQAGIADWEEATRWRPFKASATPTTRHFNGPESNLLPLRAGLLSLTSLAINNVVYTENQQFVLGVPNAPEKGRPYTYVDFGTSPFGSSWVDTWGGNFANLGVIGGGRRIIAITGLWGFCTSVPADAKRAVLGRAFCHLVPQLSLQISGGLVSSRDQNSEVRFAGGKGSPLLSEMTTLQTEFDNKVLRYRRSGM